MVLKWRQMASVTTYSQSSSRTMRSSAWSTLMISSISREMLLAKRSRMLVTVIAVTSEDLRSVVVFGVEHAHESQTRGTLDGARVEQHGRHFEPALELLQEGVRAVQREQGTSSHDEHHVTQRVGVSRQLGRDEPIQRLILAEHLVDSLDGLPETIE